MPLPNQPPSTTNLLSNDHPHPLRSHRSSEDILATSPQTPASHPTYSQPIGLNRPHTSDGGRQQPPRRSFRSSRGRRDSLHVLPPVPSVPAKAVGVAAEEGFRDGARVGAGGGEVPLSVALPVRPPLRPTVSFSSVSLVSYYSATSPTREMKTMSVAMEEKLEGKGKEGRDWRFCGCFTCLCLLNFVCDLSITAFSTTLPTVSKDLGLTAVQTFWIPGSLLLSAALAQPLFMRLSVALGCKSLLLSGISLFTAGSILAACAKDAILFISGRSIEGVGVGAITVLTQLTSKQISRGQGHPAEHRRIFSQAASHLFWLGVAAGPIIGGACAETVGWRSILWIQIAFGLLVLITLPVLLRLPYIEAGPVWSRLLRVDILGWLLLSGSIASISVALSWGGTWHSWSSIQVTLPLALGVIGVPLWCVYNRYRIEAILPVSIFLHESAATACFGAFAHGTILAAIINLMPVFFQVQGLSELVSGICLAPWTFSIVAFGLLGGAVQSLGGYRWTIWTGWGFVTLGIGLMILFKETSKAAMCAPIGLIGGIALGMLLPGQTTAIASAASTDDETIHAAPLHIHLTTLGQSFGVIGGGSIFLNTLQSKMLHNSYLSSNAPNYIEHAVSMIKVIVDLPAEQSGLHSNLITVYTTALRPVWITACAIAGLAFFLSFWFLEDHTPPRRPSLPELE